MANTEHSSPQILDKNEFEGSKRSAESGSALFAYPELRNTAHGTSENTEYKYLGEHFFRKGNLPLAMRLGIENLRRALESSHLEHMVPALGLHNI
jgi:hypothetical protein